MADAHSFTNDDLDTLRKAAKILRIPVGDVPAALSYLPTAITALPNTSVPNHPTATTSLYSASTPNQPVSSSAGHSDVLHLGSPDAYGNPVRHPLPSNHLPGISADSSFSTNYTSHLGFQDAVVPQANPEPVSTGPPPGASTHFTALEDQPLGARTGSELFMNPLHLQHYGGLEKHQQRPSSGFSYDPSLEPGIVDFLEGAVNSVTTSQSIYPLVANVTTLPGASITASSDVNLEPAFGMSLSPMTGAQASDSNITSFQITNEFESGPNTTDSTWFLEGPNIPGLQQSMHSGQISFNPEAHQSDDFLTQSQERGEANSLSLSKDKVSPPFNFACDSTINLENINTSPFQHPGHSGISWLDELFPMIPEDNQSSYSAPPQNSIATESNYPPPQQIDEDSGSLSQPGPQRLKKSQAKRGPYHRDERRQTALTRTLRGCIRCRMNRKRVIFQSCKS